ncbi:hypothetical protein Q9L42_000815 [Methylomarinum sp. Ch1-1]|uniref:Response regulator n=1 Tax=Methylomarinum roseum TaxID=3067653 RepID=A0AAU7NUN7_9GAMM|nr:hypothetical protein [Methylomarinum sp. Ch1-1]MDP4519207.1 hypothetical protein [Methylomarinum sp. Ch1-1]
MTTVYIIDNTGDLISAAGRRLANASVCENEVQCLNRLETGEPAIVFCYYPVLDEVTIELIEMLRQVNAAAEIIVVGNQLPEEQIIKCLLAGAKGYQNIDTLSQYIDKLIKVVAGGEAWVSRKMVAKLIDYWRRLHPAEAAL